MSPNPDSFLSSGSWDSSKATASTQLAGAVRWFLELIKPSFMTKRTSRKQVGRAAYLDGLRGFAAFIVYWQHHQLWPLRQIPSNRILENAWGFEGKYYFATLPIVRTFFTGGHFAVSLFFVISGFVLSAKPLALIYAGEFDNLSANVGSALFRRWMRLHIPVIVVTWLYMTSWHAFDLYVVSPERLPTYRAELWNWYAEYKKFSFAFSSGGDPWFSYNFPTWSIPVEFRGSVVVYTTLLALSRATRNARLLCQLGLIFYFFYIVDGWFCAMFVGGMLLSELELLARNDNLPRFMTRLEPWKNSIFYSFLAVASIFSGAPSYTGNVEDFTGAPGWRHMLWLKPEAAWNPKWIYLFISAMCLVSAIPRMPRLRAFFELPFNQYLGRISFSLYLIHGPIIWTFADRLYVAAGWYREAHETNIPAWIDCFPLSKAGPLGLEPAFLLPHIIVLPFTLWVAEMVTKLIDEPTLQFARWFYGKTLETSPKPLLLPLPLENRD